MAPSAGRLKSRVTWIVDAASPVGDRVSTERIRIKFARPPRVSRRTLGRQSWEVMSDIASTCRRVPSLGEEIANSISHAVGVLAALAGTPFLVLAAARRGGSVAIVGASVFAGTTVALYLASTLYHALP